MLVSGIGTPIFTPTVQAQTIPGGAPVGQGFILDAGDLRFIYQQILVAQDHAAGGTLLGPGANQVADPQLPRAVCAPSTARSTTSCRCLISICSAPPTCCSRA